MTQIYADMESKPAYRNPGVSSETLTIRAFGFIRIESAKSAVKIRGLSLFAALPRLANPYDPWCRARFSE